MELLSKQKVREVQFLCQLRNNFCLEVTHIIFSRRMDFLIHWRIDEENERTMNRFWTGISWGKVSIWHNLETCYATNNLDYFCRLLNSSQRGKGNRTSTQLQKHYRFISLLAYFLFTPSMEIFTFEGGQAGKQAGSKEAAYSQINDQLIWNWNRNDDYVFWEIVLKDGI